jgi:transcriptional regulator with XRE-family HTH domain
MQTTTTWKDEADARRTRRVLAGLTLADLGARIGLSASQLQRYERGKAAANADIIERWNAALDGASAATEAAS